MTTSRLLAPLRCIFLSLSLQTGWYKRSVVWAALISLALASNAWADEAASEAPAQRDAARPRIGLVLSGGGARGFAHVGVLKVLEEARVPVDFIAGTSMGAIIGGLYASGLSPQEIEREIVGLDWDGLFERREPRQLLSERRKEQDFELAPLVQLGYRDGQFRLPTGAISARGLEMVLRRYTLPVRDIARFEHLPIPFQAVATDMENGQAVVLSHGDLATALRASMSVPGVFAPIEIDGRILGDGGLVNNLPVDVVRKMGADIVIAVNIGTPLAGREALGSLLGITTQMVNILTEQNVRRSIDTLKPTDLLLQPPLGPMSSADFAKAPDLLTLGETYARSVRASIDRLALDAPAYTAWASHRKAHIVRLQEQPGQLAQLRIEGVDKTRTGLIGKLFKSQPGQKMDVSQIEGDLRQLAATGDYERVDYKLERIGDTADEALIVRLRENGWGPNYIGLGLDLRTDFSGQSAFNLRLNHNRRWLNDDGAEWRTNVQLGETLQASTELYQPVGIGDGRFVSVHLDGSLRRVELFDEDGAAAAIVNRRSAEFGIDYGRPLGVLGHLGDARVGLFHSRRRTRPELVGGVLASLDSLLAQRWKETGLRLAMVTDQLDHANFPSEGHRFKAEYAFGRRTIESYGSQRFNRFETSAVKAMSSGKHTLNLGFRLARVSELAIGALDEYSLGGFQRLSGYPVGQVIGNHLLFGRLTYYQRLPWNSGIARALFAGGSLEAGNAWSSSSEVSLRNLLWGSSLFVGADTSMGPLYFSLVSAPKGYTGLYLFLGRP